MLPAYLFLSLVSKGPGDVKPSPVSTEKVVSDLPIRMSK